jgi:hypothetical protein
MIKADERAWFKKHPQWSKSNRYALEASGKIKKPEIACSVRLFLIKYPYGVLP